MCNDKPILVAVACLKKKSSGSQLDPASAPSLSCMFPSRSSSAHGVVVSLCGDQLFPVQRNVLWGDLTEGKALKAMVV